MHSRLRRSLLATAVLLLGSAALWKLSSYPRWQVCGELVWRLPTTQKEVALTFDDGPASGHVDGVLATLRQAGARGTFFLNGESIAAHPEEVRKMVAAGHEVGNHSHTHARLILRSDDRIRDEVETTDALLRGLGVEGELLFRPPYGKRLLGLPRFLARTGRRTVTWTLVADADPSRGRDPESIARHVVDGVEPGAIVLFHVLLPSRGPERDALPRVLSRLKAQGYRFVTVSEALQSA